MTKCMHDGCFSFKKDEKWTVAYAKNWMDVIVDFRAKWLITPWLNRIVLFMFEF